MDFIMIDYDKAIKERCSKYPILTYDHCIMITHAAKSLSIAEVYDYMLLDESDLTVDERKFVSLIYRRGKTLGIKEACDNMFLQMRMRGGGQTALDYLARQSGEFKAVIAPTSGGKFSFSVVLPEQLDE
jgi:hypothetical protein